MMRLKYLLLTFFVFFTACNISEEDADKFFQLALKNKGNPYLALQYYDRASAHEKYRVYPVAIQLFDIGGYVWQRKDVLDVNQVYVEEAIIKSVEIFYEIGGNENSDPAAKFKSLKTLAMLFDSTYSNYHIIAKKIIDEKDPSFVVEIEELLNDELEQIPEKKSE